MDSKLFMNRKKRDEEFKRLKNQGFQVRKSSIRNQLLHPMYIEDYPVEIEEEDKGFGNTLYKTNFSVLYELIIE